MRPVAPALSASFALLALAWQSPATAQGAGPFRDVPTTHWAYMALVGLQRNGLVTGYPNDYFQGKRTLTRYEFAVALKRALDRIPISSDLKVTEGELKELRRLTDEFQADLALLGEIKKDIDACFAILERRQQGDTGNAAPSTPGKIDMPILLPSSGGSSTFFNFLTPSRSLLSPNGIDVRPAISLDTTPEVSPLNPTLFSGVPTSEGSGVRLLTDPLGSGFALPTSPGVGVQLSVPLMQRAQLGMTLEDYVVGALSGGVPHDVVSYGTDLTMQAARHLTLGAGVIRSVSEHDLPGDGLTDNDNDAYRIHIGYNSGPASALLGYQIVDPHQDDVPNAQGPFTRLAYRFSDSLRSYLGGDLYVGGRAHSFAASDALNSSLLTANIYRGAAGVSWSPLRGLSLSADYAGVLYDLSGTNMSTGRRSPLEQYITLGAGLNLSRNAILKLAYQIVNQQDGSDDSTHTNSASVFTTQFSVHF